jgi:hypothetical protein
MTRALVEPGSITVLATYKCTAACENCCFGSNPFITKRLSLEVIQQFIEEGARLPSCKLVVFSGGETFLLREDLNEAIKYATDLGLATRCVTNGYWAKRMDRGRKRLAGLVDAGLKELNVSTGDYHQQWVSQDAVVNAACLSVELGMRETVVVVEMQRERRVSADTLSRDDRIRALLDNERNHFKIVQSPWMPMTEDQVIEQPPEVLLNRNTLHMRGGCSSILSTLVLTPDQRVGVCCGLTREQIPELNGQWSDGLTSIVEQAGADFLKLWLAVDGPERILAWAATKDPTIEWENKYAHHCHACVAIYRDPRVRSVIRTHYQERVDDVLMRYSLSVRARQAAPQQFELA